MTEENIHITNIAPAEPTIHFVSVAGKPVVIFKSNGNVEFGETYRNSPDEAAREFCRIVVEHWPAVIAQTLGSLKAALVEQFPRESCETLTNSQIQRRIEHAFISMRQSHE